MRRLTAMGVLISVFIWLWAPIALAQAKPEGTMTWALHVTIAPTWLDPAETPGVITPFIFLYTLHDALIKPMPGALMTPCLAESWSVSPDGLVYTFKLRQGLTFHNGDPFGAEDVQFSFERYKGAAAKELQGKVKEIKVTGPHAIEFHLKEPWPDFLTFYATPASGAAWIVPKKYLQAVGDEGFKQHPIGLGPYKFVSHTPGVELVVEAFEGYWRKVPHVRRLIYKSVPEETTRLSMLKNGEADVAYLLQGPLAEEAKADPKLTLAPVYPPNATWINFVEQWDAKSPWHDVRVRQAANHALDHQALNEAETLGLSKLTGSIIPRAMEFALPIDPPRYDPERAKKLLAEAGYPRGFEAGDLTPLPPYFSLAEGVANYLGAVGIKVRVRSMERAAFLGDWRAKKLRGLVLALSGAYGNAATRIEAFVAGSGAFAYGSYQDIDELFRQQAVELDPQKRQALLQQIQRLIHDKAMFAPIWELAFINAYGPRVAESGLGLIPLFAYSGPLEDLRLKR
ncbi:MAG: ABC transporter substrate-binding protein [Candidatus Tectomicrobia bacterium]|jgi:peptide/nickel transport system substrate-binding protein|nr:ABC transporter substrate-binding protein [Candidatus Tectomicrobia bacterium]